MRDRLPVHIENRELPKYDTSYDFRNNNSSYGYVNVMYLVSIIITFVSVLTVFLCGK